MLDRVLVLIPSLALMALPAGAAEPQGPLRLPGPFLHDKGFAYIANPGLDWPSDGPEDALRSSLVVLEDGEQLGPAHASHHDVRSQGGGRYSHWNGKLWFSTSDNSDPRRNGRRYEVRLGEVEAGPGAAEYRSVPLPDPFQSLAGRLPPPPAPPSERERRPSLVYIYVIDALRHEVPFLERDGVAVMPTLRAFAEQSIVFERAYAPSSFTKMSTSSLMTGLSAVRTGVLHQVVAVHPRGALLSFNLDPRFYTLGEMMADAGYETVSHPFTVHARPGIGPLQGFARFDLDPAAPGPVPAVDGPTFLYEHILGVHSTYDPSRRARTRLALADPESVDPASTAWYEAAISDANADDLFAAYLGEASDADEAFARRMDWFRERGLYDDALIVVTADHGESFGAHGRTRHASDLYEEVVRVPFFLKFPAGDPRARHHGTRVPNRIGWIDLYPTLLDLVGGRAPAYPLDGRSLLAVLDGDESAPDARDVMLRMAAVRTIRGEPRVLAIDAIISGRLKAQFGYRLEDSQVPDRFPYERGDWVAELFDLGADPEERRNLVEERPDDFARLMRRYAEHAVPLTFDGVESGQAGDEVSEDLLERLEALGYAD